MAVKPTKHADYKEVTYNSARWALLKELRSKAQKSSCPRRVSSAVSYPWKHSARRRKENSDIDVFIPEVQNSFLVETPLEKARIQLIPA